MVMSLDDQCRSFVMGGKNMKTIEANKKRNIAFMPTESIMFKERETSFPKSIKQTVELFDEEMDLVVNELVKVAKRLKNTDQNVLDAAIENSRNEMEISRLRSMQIISVFLSASGLALSLAALFISYKG